MATIKSYTDLNQSRKLAEILPLESADMVYIWHATSDNPTFRFDDDMPPMVLKNVPIDEITAGTLPCWSLSALLDILPKIHGLKPILDLEELSIQYSGIDLYVVASNPVDACYETILKLHELKML